MVEAVLSYVVRAVDEASSTMDKVRASIGLVGSAIGDLGGGFTSVGNIMQGFAGAGVVGATAAGLGELIKGLEASVKQATDTEAIFTDLGAAIERSGTSWKTVEAGTRSALLAMETTTTYSKDTLAGALEKLMTFGLSYDAAMKALGATIDFAAAKHMDLETAATLVGKAVDGNTSIMKRYGVDITEAKDATDKLTPVLTALNDQFGGAAQAAANTYAGAQERLNNAWGEVSEKVGNILLPALASITEGMIPVVDWLGNGVDAIQGWLTEVGKMPEVQGIMAAVNEAFSGLWKYLNDVWKFIVDNFGPALKELFDAFKELYDAFSPVFDALKELASALGDTGNYDLFKGMLMVLVIDIRAIAEIIKEVAPYIKMFADEFKAAADFITPILTQIVGAVRFFIDTLHTIFQDFYNWLIGGSLWTDMWNQILTVTAQMVAQLLGDLQSKLFDKMTDAFQAATQSAQNIWNKTWQAIQSTFETVIGQIQGSVNTNFDNMRAFITENMGQYAPIANSALNAMWFVVDAALALVKGDWQGAIGEMEDAWTAFTGFISGAIAGLNTALGGAQTSVQTTISAIEAAASSAVGSVQSTLGSAWNAITGVVAGAQQAVSTAASLLTPSPPTSAVPAGAQSLNTTSTLGSTGVSVNTTIPITVTLDGQVITKTVKKVLIEDRQYRGRSGGSVM